MPLPATLDKEPDILADLAAAHQADTIVVDSLKDAMSTLVDDALANAFNNARQRAMRDGVEIIEPHHQRKAAEGTPRTVKPTLDRVYGSTWITSGAGSVLFVSGEAGDLAVDIHHLKHPTGEIGPLQVIHDHERGTTTVDPAFDPAQILRQRPTACHIHIAATKFRGDLRPARHWNGPPTANWSRSRRNTASAELHGATTRPPTAPPAPSRRKPTAPASQAPPANVYAPPYARR